MASFVRLPKALATAARVAFLVGFAALSLPASTMAREPSGPEMARLDTTVEGFVVALESADIARILKTLPPRLLEALARESDVSVDELIDAVGETTEEAMSSVSIETLSFDATQVSRTGETEDGLLYGFLPFVFRMTLYLGSPDAEVYIVESEVFALLDEGEWYLLRIEDPEQASLLVDAYPTLAGVTFENERVRRE